MLGECVAGACADNKTDVVFLVALETVSPMSGLNVMVPGLTSAQADAETVNNKNVNKTASLFMPIPPFRLLDFVNVTIRA
jgi:uncharacterized membrane protein YjjB (DUF3815 family)